MVRKSCLFSFQRPALSIVSCRWHWVDSISSWSFQAGVRRPEDGSSSDTKHEHERRSNSSTKDRSRADAYILRRDNLAAVKPRTMFQVLRKTTLNEHQVETYRA
jgi:hypothetical protein